MRNLPLQRHKHSGFTLLELMTSIAVTAVLLSIAVPAFTGMVRANQIAAESNSAMSALALARSEAVKRGIRVSVCAVDDPNLETPDCESDWNRGWIVFADDFGDPGVMDASDFVLQAWPAIENGVTVEGPADGVTFARTGRAELARTMAVTKEGCGEGQRRDIAVALSGRVSLTRSNCS